MSSVAFAMAPPPTTVTPANAAPSCQKCASTPCVCGKTGYVGLSKNMIVETVRPITPALPGEPTGFWFEMGAFAGLATEDINGAYPALNPQGTGASNLFENLDNPGVGEVNIVGADITGGYDLNDNFAITFNIGYGYGSAANTDRITGDILYRERVSVHTFTFMPGVRYTYDLSPQWTLYAGLAAGIANESVKYKISEREFGMQRSHDSEWGFAYSAQIGAQYHFCTCMYAYAAYEFRGSLAEPTLIHQAPVSSEAQSFHVLRVGVGFKF